jgi:ABC-type multidrug transport system fused ATPase/permease subunit
MKTVHPLPSVAPAANIGQQTAAKTLKSIAKAYPGQISFTLSLVALENALLLAYPLFAGFAVDSIIRGDVHSAIWYAAVVLSFWLVGAARRAMDTRTFTRIYADLAVDVVLAQRLQNQPTSTSAARVVLAREFVDFFEKHVPTITTALVSMVGAAVMLVIIEPWVGCAALVALLLGVTRLPRFARRNEQLHGRLNNRLEHEIRLVERTGPRTLLRHYTVLSKLRIWLSDREASAFVVVGTAAALLFALTIFQLATTPSVKPGHVYAVMTYLWTFVTSLDDAPTMVDQLARLKDIGKRVSPGLDDSNTDSAQP